MKNHQYIIVRVIALFSAAILYLYMVVGIHHSDDLVDSSHLFGDNHSDTSDNSPNSIKCATIWYRFEIDLTSVLSQKCVE